MKMEGFYDWVFLNYWYEIFFFCVGLVFGFGLEFGVGVGIFIVFFLMKFFFFFDFDDFWKNLIKLLYYMFCEGLEFIIW